jgi:hypothetical protein
LKVQLKPYIGTFLKKYKVLQNVQLIKYIEICWWISKSFYWNIKVFVNFEVSRVYIKTWNLYTKNMFKGSECTDTL